MAIVDFDVHHGNGTQAIFEHDPRVLYLSSHQSPLYPDSGACDEIGVGNIVNAPLPPGSDGAMFRAAWQHRLLPALDAFAPQLLLVSAGFDGHRLDPLADLRLEADDYAWLSGEIAALGRPPCRGPHRLHARRRLQPERACASAAWPTCSVSAPEPEVGRRIEFAGR